MAQNAIRKSEQGSGLSLIYNVKQPGRAAWFAENYSSVLQIGCQIFRVGIAPRSTGGRIIRGSTPHRPADRNRMGFRSPPRAALRIRKAICTFSADVLASMGMLCSASTKTRFKSASVSGSKFAPSCSAILSRSVGSIERCYKLAAARRLRACEFLLTSSAALGFLVSEAGEKTSCVRFRTNVELAGNLCAFSTAL
jgi:hypothetical protein